MSTAVPPEAGAPLRVLMSFERPRATTNPYIVQLFEGLREHPDVEPQLFSWRRALSGKYDLFHVQWVETMLAGRTPLRRRAKELLYLALLGLIRVRGAKLVRTAHNLTPHDPQRGLRGLAVRLTERCSDLVIRLNGHTELLTPTAAVTIPHGHYRDWLAPHRVEVPRAPRRVLYFGLIRPYKGIEDLLDVIADQPSADIELRIVGAPLDEALARRIRAAAASDPRVTCDLRYVDDATLTVEVLSAGVVVLPYRAMHNSGALLLALSLDTPVLAPSNAVTEELAAEVGPSWLRTFEGSLTMDDIRQALDVASRLANVAPDLSARDWPPLISAHVSAYRSALLGERQQQNREGEHEVGAGAQDRAEEDIPQ